jgi:methyltransferase (TIGR00027 family)
MDSAGVSMTARRVAAHRCSFERLPASFGRPVDDDRLQRDVADDVEMTESFMTGYLRSRTRFFDRVVVEWVNAGATQLVSVGAGFDGRSLRYAKAGTRWFELDLAGTQADKRQRLARLGIATDGVCFVPVDFAVDDPAAALVEADLDRSRPTLFTCEGVAGYLSDEVLARLLRSLAVVAVNGSRLAITVALEPATAEAAARRQALAGSVGSMGEPLRSSIPREGLAPWLTAQGWRLVAATDPYEKPIAESQSSSAFVIAETQKDTPDAG